MLKINLKYFFLSFALFFIELLIALYLHDSIIRPYIGDILVVILVYCAVRTFFQGIKLLPLYVFFFAVSVEIIQLFNIASLLNLEHNAIRIAIGSTFDWSDILCYFIGALLCACIQWIDKKNNVMR